MLTSENFTARLKQANLANKSDIAHFVKKTDLSKKFKAISTKGIKNDLINKFSILNGAKHFSSGIFYNYLCLLKSTLKILVTLLGLIRGNLTEC